MNGLHKDMEDRDNLAAPQSDMNIEQSVTKLKKCETA